MGTQASQAFRQSAANADLADVGLPGYTLLQIEAVLRQGPVYAALREDDGAVVSVLEFCPSHQARRTASGVRPIQGQTQAFEQGLKDFQHESRMLARVDHPGLIHVLEHLHARGTGYRVMPAWRGKLLSTLLAEPPNQRDQAGLLSLLDGLTSVLRSLHKRHSVHGWLSPDSILMIEPPDHGSSAAHNAPANPVMLDLGRAGLLPGSSRQTEFHPVSHLQAWLAPEALHAETSEQLRLIGPWTDIYGLAAILHQWISGEQPQPAASRLMMDLQQAVSVWQGCQYDHETLLAVDIGLAMAPKDRGRSVESWRRRFPGGAVGLRHPSVANLALQRPTDVAAAPRSDATQSPSVAGSTMKPSLARASLVSSRPGKAITPPDPALLAMLAAGRAAATSLDAAHRPSSTEPERHPPAGIATASTRSRPAAAPSLTAASGKASGRTSGGTQARPGPSTQRARRWLGPSGPSNLVLLSVLALLSVAMLLTATITRVTDEAGEEGGAAETGTPATAARKQQSGPAPMPSYAAPTMPPAADQAQSASASLSTSGTTQPGATAAQRAAPAALPASATVAQTGVPAQRGATPGSEGSPANGARAVGQIRRICDDITLRVSLGGALTPDELKTLTSQCR